MYAFVEEDTERCSKFEIYKEAWNAYENSESKVKGVFRLRGDNSPESINVTAGFFNGELDTLKEIIKRKLLCKIMK